MPPKTSKTKNPISSGKEKVSAEPTPWPNLPHQITALLARQPNLMYRITSFGCVTKSWRSSPKQCSRSRGPHLVEIDLKDDQKIERPHVVEITFHQEIRDFDFDLYKRRKSYDNYNCPGIYFKGYSHGLVVVLAPNRTELYLWKPARLFLRCSHWMRSLPKWNPNLPFKTCILSGFPEYSSGCNIMVITGICSPAFAFYRMDDYMENDIEWTVQNCTVKEPYAPGQCMQFTNAIGCHGKFYALSLQGSLAVIEDVKSRFTITAIGANRAVPSGLWRQFREYLVQLDGDVFLVLLLSRKSVDHVDDVQVFRLDVAQLVWIKVGCIRDKAMFVEDECCMGVTARNVGCKKNCIYFTHHRIDVWHKFDIESGKISAAYGYDDGMQEFVKWEEPILEIERFKIAC